MGWTNFSGDVIIENTLDLHNIVNIVWVGRTTSLDDLYWEQNRFLNERPKILLQAEMLSFGFLLMHGSLSKSSTIMKI